MQNIAHEKLENDYILINLQKNYDSFLNNSRIRNKCGNILLNSNTLNIKKNSNCNINTNIKNKCPLSITNNYNQVIQDHKVISLQN